ncbi:hypothetical protein [Brevibacillus centrosporus]|uniref:hypothetical protein n=1 Tax=Brevibacillus centrosporus TaxID=54910 RepID=UPI003B01A004
MENLMNAELEMEMQDMEDTVEDFEPQDDLEVGESVDDDQDIDLSEFTPSVCNQQGRTVSKAGAMSVVSSKNGTRVALSQGVIEHLHHPDSIQIGFSDHQIAIAKHLGDHYTSYSMKQSGTKSIIYCKELVKQITERYGLDFRNRTSITLSEVKYVGNGNSTVAFIQVDKR